MIELDCNYPAPVTLNSFQGPFIRSGSGRAARWMLKQVQHDDVFEVVSAA
jgi:hypothetical protein